MHNLPVTPDELIAMAPQPNATEFTPDFSIVKTHVILQPTATTTIDSWDHVEIKAFIVPFIAELKHLPTCQSPSLILFVKVLISMFNEAYCGLENQVENTFLMQSKVNRIMMFAAVGEWWTWKIATHDHYVTDSDDDEAESTCHSASNNILTSLFDSTGSSNPNLGCMCIHKPCVAKMDNVKYTSPPSPPIRPSDKLSYHPCRKWEPKERQLEYSKCYKDLGACMEQVTADVELAKLLDNNWSNFIQLGSPASNQCLFLIHWFLSMESTAMLNATVLVWLFMLKMTQLTDFKNEVNDDDACKDDEEGEDLGNDNGDDDDDDDDALYECNFNEIETLIHFDCQVIGMTFAMLTKGYQNLSNYHMYLSAAVKIRNLAICW